MTEVVIYGTDVPAKRVIACEFVNVWGFSTTVTLDLPQMKSGLPPTYYPAATVAEYLVELARLKLGKGKLILRNYQGY